MAFLVQSSFEAGLSEIHAESLPVVIRVLSTGITVVALYESLPVL